MLHIKLLEVESERIAREEAKKALNSAQLPPECDLLKEFVEEEVGLKLGSPCDSNFCGWLSYRRTGGEILILRGRAFKEGMFGKWKAGLDVPYGAATASEYLRGYDVSPPQDLDHLMLNFGKGENVRVFIWYGENISPYRLIYEADLDDSRENLIDALSEGMTWILTKPRELTLPQFIKEKLK